MYFTRKQYEDRYTDVRRRFDDTEGYRDAYRHYILEHQELYSHTLSDSLYELSSLWSIAMLPYGEHWIKFIPGIALSNDENAESFSRELDEYTKWLFFYIEQSPFYRTVDECLPEFLWQSGTLRIDSTGDPDKPLRFRAVNMGKIIFEEYPDGTIRGHWLKHKGLLIRELDKVAMVPLKLTEVMKQSLQKDVNAKTDLVEAVLYSDEHKRYEHIIWDEGMDAVLYYNTDISSPFISFRYRKTTGLDIYGTGIGMRGLSRAKHLDNTCSRLLESINLRLKPPFLASSDMDLDALAIKPDAVIQCSNLVEKPFVPLELSSRLMDVMPVIAKMEQDIQSLLMVKALGDIMNYKDRTATESEIRQREMEKKRAPAVHRWNQEFIMPVIDRILYCLTNAKFYRGKAAPMKPLELYKNGFKYIDIEFTDPLKNLVKSEKFHQMLQTIAGITQAVGDPGGVATAFFNIDQLSEVACDAQLVDPKVAKTPDGVQQAIMRMKEEAMNQMQMAQERNKDGQA